MREARGPNLGGRAEGHTLDETLFQMGKGMRVEGGP